MQEREAELARLDELLDSARAGKGSALLVSGEAGIGKSALLAAARERAAGMRVLSAAGGSLERDFGFGVARRLFGDLPQLPDAFEARHALYRMAIEQAREQPLLVCVDDAHWADLATLHALVFLARRIADEPIALVVAERTGEPGEHEPLLRALVAEAGAHPLELRTLTAAGVRAMVGDRLDADHCLRLTRGNPFLVRELMAAGDDAPVNVARSVLLRLSRLGPDALALAESAAILDGGPLQIGGTLAGLQEPAEAADRLAAARILEPGGLRFIHPLVREAVYRDIGVARRSAGHRRAAELLDGDLAALHAEATEPSGDAWVARVLLEAGRRAADRGAHAEAARLLRRALDEPPPRELRGAVLAALGSALLDAGDPAPALEYLREGMALAEDPSERLAAGRRLALALMSVGRTQDSVTLIDALVGSVARTEHERAELVADVLVLLRHGEDVETYLARAREVVASGGGSPRLLAALAYRDAVSVRGTADACAALALSALGDGDLLNESDPGSPQMVLAVTALILAERFGDAERWGEVVHASAAGVGAVRSQITSLLLRARLAQARGDLAAAEETARRALTLGGPGALLDPPSAWGVIVGCAIDRGTAEEVAAELAAANLTGGLLEARAGTWAFTMRRAMLHHVLGRHDEALADVEHGSAIRAGRGLLADTTRAEVLWGAGRAEDAVTAAEAGLAVAESWGAPGSLGMAQRVLGVVRGDAGRLEQAVATLARSERRVEHARALIDLGALLRRTRRRVEAREPLSEGMEIAHRCGAHALVARAREELVATGARPRRAVRTGVDALTPSELRVARLAAAGRTNREIAHALFVAPRTVQTHLQAIYRKLDVSGRDELAGKISYPPDDANAAGVSQTAAP